MSAKKSLPKLLPVDLYEPTAEDLKRFETEIAFGMVQPSDPLLSEPAKRLAKKDLKSPELKALIRQLLDIASGQRDLAKTEKKRRVLVGLASPQLGQLRQVIVVDTQIDPERKRPGKVEVFVNPKIIWRSRETDEGREGCFSTGLVYGLVRRPTSIKLHALTVDGKPFERDFTGFTARIIQHEIDHLHGIRFPDRIRSDKKRHWVHTEELLEYPKRITQWPRLCSKERWEATKHPG